jgi:hypothetical protein
VDALTFFRSRYEPVHGRYTDDLLGELSERQLRARPHPAVNTIAWLLWHMARTEDVGVNRLVADREQVFDDGGWDERLAVPRRDIGTAMTDAEVDELSGGLDLAALREYWAAVGRRTVEVVAALRPGDLDAISGGPRVQRLTGDEGVLVDRATWVAEMWADMSRGAALCQLGLAHNYGHLYEARTVKSLWGFKAR